MLLLFKNKEGKNMEEYQKNCVFCNIGYAVFSSFNGPCRLLYGQCISK